MARDEKRSSSASDEHLLREMYPALRAFAAVVGPREVGPDDLLHNVIVRALRHAPLHTRDHPYSYLRQGILNEASNQRRRLGSQRRGFLRLVRSTDHAADDVYPTDLADLEQLEPVARAVLFLHEIDGYSYREVADHLDISEVNARQIARRARRTLRIELEDQG